MPSPVREWIKDPRKFKQEYVMNWQNYFKGGYSAIGATVKRSYITEGRWLYLIETKIGKKYFIRNKGQRNTKEEAMGAAKAFLMQNFPYKKHKRHKKNE